MSNVSLSFPFLLRSTGKRGEIEGSNLLPFQFINKQVETGKTIPFLCMADAAVSHFFTFEESVTILRLLKHKTK